jgi:hypothetical protein
MIFSTLGFFHEAPNISGVPFQIFSKILGDISSSTGVVKIGGKCKKSLTRKVLIAVLYLDTFG